MMFRYSDLVVPYSSWSGYCFRCSRNEPHATLFGSSVVTRCMTCGHDEILSRMHG